VAEIEGYQKVIDGARAVLDNYRPHIPIHPDWPMVELGSTVDILDSQRRPITKHDRKPGPYPYYGATGVLDHVEGYLFDEPLVLVGEDGAKWGAGENTAYAISGKTWVNNHAHVLRPNRDRLMDLFLITALNAMNLSRHITGVTVPKLNQEKLRSIPIPLPPLETQRAIVAEIEAEQTLVNANRELIARMEKKIRATLARVWGEKKEANSE
jgi:type I restriction enzyme, S subunit